MTLFLGELLWRKTVGVICAGRIGATYARMMVEGLKNNEIAERLVVLGFFDEVISQLPSAELAADLRARVAAKLKIGDDS